MKKFLIYFVSLVFMVSARPVFAEIKTPIKEYTYQAGELGTYVEVTTVVQDYQIETGIKREI